MDTRGFTLIELLIALAVAGILLTIAVPGYAFLVNSTRLAAVTNDLVSSIQSARSEAVKRGIRVTVCKVGAAGTTCDASGSWQQGWLVFVDGGSPGVTEPGDAILWKHGQSAANVMISSYNYDDYVSYLPAGTSQGSIGLANGTISVCMAGKQRDIIINRAGRVRIENNGC